ncbi:MAG: hypothetical protein K2L45_09245, partial [Muribaculaceae bacterium]|nr:hypothetical protein [Muribaculaceae bacterium]
KYIIGSAAEEDRAAKMKAEEANLVNFMGYLLDELQSYEKKVEQQNEKKACTQCHQHRVQAFFPCPVTFGGESIGLRMRSCRGRQGRYSFVECIMP